MTDNKQGTALGAPLLTVRTAVVLLAVVCGVLAGGLAALAGQALPAATLVGSGAAGGGPAVVPHGGRPVTNWRPRCLALAGCSCRAPWTNGKQGPDGKRVAGHEGRRTRTARR